MSRSESAALPIANLVLRILIILNWVVFAATIVLLVAMPTRQWIMVSLNLSPGPEAERVILGMRSIAVIGLMLVPIYHFILTRLLAIVGTVRAGDPFVAANAARLHRIGWALLVLQGFGLAIGLIVKAISAPAHPVNISAGPTIPGLLAVLLTFILARVFAEGARMRDDLEGTV
jgi:uncharacterized protein YacL